MFAVKASAVSKLESNADAPCRPWGYVMGVNPVLS